MSTNSSTTRKAPLSDELKFAVEQIVNTLFTIELEQVLFLGPNYKVREVLYPSDGMEALAAKRAELLASRKLGAIIHLRAGRSGQYMVYSLVEDFGDDPTNPARYVYGTWPRNEWVRTDQEFTWSDNWEEGEG